MVSLRESPFEDLRVYRKDQMTGADDYLFKLNRQSKAIHSLVNFQYSIFIHRASRTLRNSLRWERIQVAITHFRNRVRRQRDYPEWSPLPV